MQKATFYDVVVAGAGPAGSTAAFLLASHGYKVCLVDKKHFPRPKLCAGLLTWKSIELLQRVFGYSREELIDNGIITHTCRNYRIYLGSKVLVRRRLEFPFHFVDRLHYDNFWLKLAAQAGCHITTGTAVIKVDPIQGMVALSDGKRLKAGTIIGADGVWSKVRQSIPHPKSHKQKWHRHLAATIETVRACPDPPMNDNHAAIHFGYLPWGYAWSFPGDNHQILGIGGLHQKSSTSIRQNFSRFLQAIGVNAGQLAPLGSHPLPYGNSLQHPARGRVLLVGDACGLADPLLGEGIYYAHRSGELAAQAIIAAGSDTTRAAHHYRALLKTHVLKELRWIKLYRNLLFAGGSKRRFRGLRLFFFLMPKRLEAAVQGQCSFSHLLWPCMKRGNVD